MDMHAREQYLDSVRQEYRQANRKQKTRLLNEARRRTRLNRKVLIRKLAHPPKPPGPRKRAARAASYGADVLGVLIQVWEIFDYPCGQRLAPALRQEVERLRQAGEVRCSEEVAGKLQRISAKTIDRLLAREKQVRRLRRNRHPGSHPGLYQKIPVKVAAEWDTHQVGHLQVDYVEHCGRSNAGEYVHTLSVTDVASGWWEGQPIAARTQEATREAMEEIRGRVPFRIREIHPDNDSGLINDLMWQYCRQRKIRMTRSRPYKKNDNAWVEQRNWTHVRQVVGYQRFDRMPELRVMQELYGRLRLYKNFFQPAMKLKQKVRMGGKIRRKYEAARTPYQRLLDSGQLRPGVAEALQQQYQRLNVAELRRQVEALRKRLFELAEGKTEPGRMKRRHGPGIWFGPEERRRQWLRARAAGQSGTPGKNGPADFALMAQGLRSKASPPG